MATLRGVTLGPGEFEARITVRQDRRVLGRSAQFRVVGDQPSSPTATDAAKGAGADTEDFTNLVLPEVDPIHLNSASAPPESEWRGAWDEAAAEALSYSSRLPNFRCHRETRRLSAPVRNAERFTESDSVKEELTYENGTETYRMLEINGQKSSTDRGKLTGVQSSGEFGSMMRTIFRPDVSQGYRYAGRTLTGGVVCLVYDFDVPVQKSNFVLMSNTRQAVAAYRGRVMIEEDTGVVRRIVMEGTSLPKDYDLQSPVLSLEYGKVRIGETDHLVPLRSVLQIRHGRKLVRNETVFRNYRKFEAESQLLVE